MSVPSMPQEEMRTALGELDQAIYNHEQWCDALYATLICRLAPDERDIDAKAYRKCRFGQWLYGRGTASLDRYPGFAEAEAEHKRMHQSAATMLLADRNRVPITMADFERFGRALKRLRLEVLTLKRELEDALFNLDPLTGAASRIGMLTKLREQRELVKRKIHSCCIAMMDLDLFKQVNDVYGHVVGNKALAAVARYASTHLRPYDKMFRYGGEEFLLCLPDVDPETGKGIIERIRIELASILHEAEGKPAFHQTASFGLTLLDPDVPVEESIDRADKALYAAKLSGRNGTAIWDASMTSAPAGQR